MTVQWSTTVRNGLLDQWETSIGTSAVIKIRTGTQPSDCSQADAGTELAIFPLASDWASGASSGTKSLSSLPLSTTAIGTGTAGHYRIYGSGTTTCHEQGSITAVGGTGDATIDNTSIVTGQTVQITSFSKTAPGV